MRSSSSSSSRESVNNNRQQIPEDGFRNLQISHVDQQYACLSEIIRGILCIHDRRSHRVDICNITTQETITLPRSTNIPIRPGAGVDFDIVYEPRYSFGFNSTTGDYKVLNICCITGYKLQVNPINGLSTREVSRKTVEFEIFTIGCDRGAGSWRKIDPGYPYDQELYGLTSESVCADGVIHWRHRLLDQEILLAFDLQQEKFQIIQVPKEALGFQLMKQVKAYYCDLETKNICMIHVPELKSVKLPCGEVGKPSDVVLTVHAENLLSLTSNAYEHAGKKG
ncbi:hypothetical protein OIU78_029890 [Salix suchowensis]|nr:hypothetical protein OIU78_029890 [Salix suchowensis]